MKRIMNLHRSHYFWAAICLFLLVPVAFGQVTAEAVKKKKPALQIDVNDSGEISLQATKANTNDLAAELSRRIKIPVVLSELMRNKTVNLTFENLPLEEALRGLAPQAHVDYVLMQKSGKLISRPLAVYLSGYNEQEPNKAQSAETGNQIFVIEGSTDPQINAPKAEQLKINISDNLLTVSARRQNLSFVISEIAARANLEFDSRYESDKIIDADIQNESLAEALLSLSPHVQVYVRRDLQTGLTTPFRVSLSKQE